MSTRGSRLISIISMLVLVIGLSVVGVSAQDTGVPVSITFQGGPTETATSTATATATASATATDEANSTSTMPVVETLPETGVNPHVSGITWVLLTMLVAGFLLVTGGLMSTRSGARSRFR